MNTRCTTGEKGVGLVIKMDSKEDVVKKDLAHCFNHNRYASG
jgi:hypothetical protein